MPINTDYQVKLRNGRSIGYAEYGHSQGKPVLHFHGTPSSRLEGNRSNVNEVATQLGIRLIFPDRPGIGLSDFQRHRTLLNWADDVTELADRLNLDQFAVLGFSGGVPHAAACAYKIPHRLTAVGLMAGISPLDTPKVFQGMSNSNRQQITIARKAPWLLRFLFWQVSRELQRSPDRAIAQLANELSEPDKAVFAHSDFQASLIQMVREAFRYGSRGVVWDQVLIARPWGFRLNEIAIKVYLWHGEMDVLCPINMGRYMAEAIPNCSAQFLPQEGHISLYANHYKEILATLISTAA
ncbi:alpha/beta hydrolase [Pleurocapsales cyanobacterium LEGE 06147]|nr:alpha/beta hydrolase [Pleurocapsales cyanobacterium LEGE 06147]